MIEIIKPDVNIDFVGKRRIAYLVSGTLILITLILLIWKGPRYGVDFTGGAVIQVRFNKKVSIDEIREALRPVKLEDSIIQEFKEKGAHEYLIRVRKTNIDLASIHDNVKDALKAKFGKGVDIRRVEMVGPKIGKQLKRKALLAIFYSILFIAIYISGRFEMKWMMSIIMAAALGISVSVASSFGVRITWLIFIAMIVTLGLSAYLKLRYALGAIIALIHDVTITVGAFLITQKEISLSVVAALLTIVGYSLNDTIIVFDRIRENLRKKKKMPFEVIVNRSINETLSRTVLTSSTTLFVVLALFLLGGNVIHDFAFAMLVGIVVGTYSSIFVASPILMIWKEEFGKR